MDGGFELLQSDLEKENVLLNTCSENNKALKIEQCIQNIKQWACCDYIPPHSKLAPSIMKIALVLGAILWINDGPTN